MTIEMFHLMTTEMGSTSDEQNVSLHVKRWGIHHKSLMVIKIHNDHLEFHNEVILR